MRLHPSYSTDSFPAEFPLSGLSDTSRCCSSPLELASVLLALARVSRDELASITIIGGPDAGFIAAVAEWYFQLTVQVTDATTGDNLYQNRPASDFVQVLILFTKRDAKDASQIQLTGKTFRLGDAVSVMRIDEHRITYLSGRVEWKEVLTTLFGPTFRRVTGHQEAFGASIGYLACIVAHISSPSEDPSPATPTGLAARERVAYLAAESTGSRLIEVILMYLPELIPFREHMEKHSHGNFSRVRQVLEKHISSLRTACQCRQCGTRPLPRGGGQKSSDEHCLVLLLFTIVRMGQIMSLVENPFSILPSREGLSRLYEGLYKAIEANGRQEKDLVEDFLFRKSMAGSGMRNILPEILTVFSKRVPVLPEFYSTEGRWLHVCAHSSSDGICVYWKALAESSGGHLTTRLIVIPGRIELDGKPYSHMIDRLHLVDLTIPFKGWENLIFARREGISGVSVPTSYGGLSVLVRETTAELQIAFEAPTLSSYAGRRIPIRPARSLEAFMLTKSIVSCGKFGCTKHLQDAEVKETKEGLTRYVYRGMPFIVFDASLAQQWYLGNHYGFQTLIFCVDGQCIDCCLARSADYVLRMGYKLQKYEAYAIVRAAPE